MRLNAVQRPIGLSTQGSERAPGRAFAVSAHTPKPEQQLGLQSQPNMASGDRIKMCVPLRATLERPQKQDTQLPRLRQHFRSPAACRAPRQEYGLAPANASPPALRTRSAAPTFVCAPAPSLLPASSQPLPGRTR